MTEVESILAVIIGLLALPYAIGPPLLLAMFKFRVPTRIVYFDPETIELPDDVAGYVEPARDTMQAAGFVPVSWFCLPDVVPNVKSISVLLVNARQRESAMINCIYADATGGLTPIKVKYVEFVTRFRDGICLQTNNSPQLSALRQPPDDHTIQFWGVHDVDELYRRHRRIGEQLTSAQPVNRLADDFRNDVEQFLQTVVLQEPFDYQVQIGLMRRTADGYRPTLKGALVLAWQELWPWRLVRKQQVRRIAHRWRDAVAAA